MAAMYQKVGNNASNSRYHLCPQCSCPAPWGHCFAGRARPSRRREVEVVVQLLQSQRIEACCMQNQPSGTGSQLGQTADRLYVLEQVLAGVGRVGIIEMFARKKKRKHRVFASNLNKFNFRFGGVQPVDTQIGLATRGLEATSIVGWTMPSRF